MMANPQDHAITAVDWLHQYFAHVEPGWVSVFSQNRTTAERVTAWAHTSTIDELAAPVDMLAAVGCVWFGVATRRRNLGPSRRGGIGECQQIPALWLDLDIRGPNHANDNLPPTVEDAAKILHRYPLQPTCVIWSGNGLQAHWALTEPVDTGDATEQLLARWGATWAKNGRDLGWHVDNVFNIDRVMRLPGTWNRKGEPVLVEIVEADWDRRYGVDDLDQWTIEPPTPPPDTTRARLPYIGPARPGDAFNAVRTGNDVLRAAGFADPRQAGGDTHWCRPGKTQREGHSATVYADGHTTLWSDTILQTWPHAQLRRPYDPFGLYTALFHAGDFRAASDELERQGYGTKSVSNDDLSWAHLAPPKGDSADEDVDDDHVVGPQPIDWPSFWNREHLGEDWIVEPLIPRGRQVALWAGHKTGKSLLSLEVAAGIATGKPCLSQPAGAAQHVVYIDLEMTEDDLHDRLDEMGYGPDTDLGRLHYYLLPSLPPLDTAAGGAAIVALVDRHQAQLVVIDTMARAVEGEENDADTYRSFYRHTGLQLKQRGCALIRLDHAGKDPTKGQRGSSSKGDDVDVVWHLHVTDDGFGLRRTAARMSWVPEKVALRRIDDPLHHEIVAGGWPQGTKEAVLDLDELGIPLDASQREASRLLKEANRGRKTDVIRAALKWRKSEADRLPKGGL